MSGLISAALSDVLSAQAGKQALAAVEPADLDNYERHWGKLPGAEAGAVSRTAAEEYFSGELLQGEALQRVMDHVVQPEAASISRQQFLSITHLVYAVLQRAQDRMFEEDALQDSPAPPPPSSKKAARHIRCDSIGGWKISAAADGGLAAKAAGAPGPLEVGVSGQEVEVPVSLLSPSMLTRPLERGASSLPAAEDSIAEQGCEKRSSTSSHQSYKTAETDPVGNEISEFEARLQGLMQQLAEQQAALDGGQEADLSAAQARLERLRQLEAQVRAELGQAQARHPRQASPAATSWQAFDSSMPSPRPGSGPTSAEVFNSAFEAVSGQPPAGVQRGQNRDAFDAFALHQRSAVPGTTLRQPSAFQEGNPLHPAGGYSYSYPAQPAGGNPYAHHSLGYPGAPPSPEVVPAGHGTAAGQEIISHMLARMQLSQPQRQPGLNSAPDSQLSARAELPAGLEPMSASDRELCEASFVSKGYQQLGGMSRGAAEHMYARTQLPPALFPQAWALADADRDGLLSRTEFCAFMTLLRNVEKGQPLPISLTWEQFLALLGKPPAIRVDLGKLRGALRPANSGGIPTERSQASQAQSQQGEHHPADPHINTVGTAGREPVDNSDADSDFDFESVTTMSVGSRSRRSGNTPQQHKSAAILSEQRERVAAWGEGDPCHSALELTVAAADVRYTKALDRPFFSIYVRDSLGRLAELPQDTPPGHYHSSTITAGHAVVLRTQLQQLPPGSVLYVEIKHWKSTEKKFSVLAWSFVPVESIVDMGPVASRVREGAMDLPLYRKPVAEGPALAKAKRLTYNNDLHLTLRGLV